MHPTNRAERRHQRERVIAQRKFTYLQVWGMKEENQRYEHMWRMSPLWEPFSEWGRYAKFNLGCGCRGCHYAKYGRSLDRRRKALKSADSQADFRKKNKVAGR